jgi:hypothetical protein
MNWVTLENQAFESRYTIVPDGHEHPFDNAEVAETIKATFGWKLYSIREYIYIQKDANHLPM